MRIIVTAKELVDKGIWDKSCDITGYNPYSLREGMDLGTEIEFTEEQAIRLDLIKLEDYGNE